MMCPQRIKLSGVAEESVVDGPGIRFVVFTQGCPHGCPGCHNPGTHMFSGGYEQSPAALFAAVRQNPLLAGVTFSGGEPLCQAEALCALGELLRAANIPLAIYTGYTLEALLAEADPQRMRLLALCGVLVDGPFVQALASPLLRFKGSANQRVLDMPRSLALGAPVPLADPAWGA